MSDGADDIVFGDVSYRGSLVATIDDTSPLLDRPLAALGIPPYDIVRVDGAEGSAFFLLDGDRDVFAQIPN